MQAKRSKRVKVKRGILSPVSGTVSNIIVSKNNVIRVQPDKKT